MGMRYGLSAGEAVWEPVRTIDEAVTAFERRWNEQREWEARFRVGDLDL